MRTFGGKLCILGPKGAGKWPNSGAPFNDHAPRPPRVRGRDLAETSGTLLGVQVKTLLVYQWKDKERVEKAAEILSRYQKPKEFEESKEEICKETKAEPC